MNEVLKQSVVLHPVVWKEMDLHWTNLKIEKGEGREAWWGVGAVRIYRMHNWKVGGGPRFEL